MSIKKGESENGLILSEMDLFIIIFSLTAGVVTIGLLELIRRFILSEPQGKRTVRIFVF
jgi:hypothetical protein